MEMQERELETLEAVKEEVAEKVTEAAETAEAISEEAAEAVEAAKEEAAEAVETVKEEAADTVEAVEAVKDEAAEAVEAVKDEAADTAEAVREEAAGAVEEAKETMEDYSEELEASFRRINEGDTLTGTVISVTDTDITLDFGYYTDGIIHLEDASDDPGFSLKDRIKVGQSLTSTVIKRDDGAGHILLSMKEAAQLMAWDRLRELKESQENVTVKISGVTRGGAIAYLEGVRGFIPASKLSLSYVEEDALQEWIGKSIDVRVITADEEDRRLVMSARDILWEKEREERAKKVSNVEVGLVTEGVVESLKPYGAFINLGNRLSGLLHVSQISQKRIKQPSEVLKEGQTVKVKIIANKDGKLSLSMKALEDVMAEEVHEETFELPKSENISTSLADLFAKLKL